jgi:hypothetical protein
MLPTAVAARCAAVCATVVVVVCAPAASAIDARSPSVSCATMTTSGCPPQPPASAYDFLVLVGVLPVPGFAGFAAVTHARCATATAAAAAESGDCPPPAGLGHGGGGPLAMMLMG